MELSGTKSLAVFAISAASDVKGFNILLCACLGFSCVFRDAAHSVVLLRSLLYRTLGRGDKG